MQRLIKLLEKPKIIVPVFAIIVLAFSLYEFARIGKAPSLPASLVPTSISNPTTPTIPSGSNVSMSFGKGGSIEAVLVKTSDQVRAGEVIARLSAPESLGAVNQAKAALDLA